MVGFNTAHSKKWTPPRLTGLIVSLLILLVIVFVLLIFYLRRQFPRQPSDDHTPPVERPLLPLHSMPEPATTNNEGDPTTPTTPGASTEISSPTKTISQDTPDAEAAVNTSGTTHGTAVDPPGA
jgi:hypothetical protein